MRKTVHTLCVVKVYNWERYYVLKIKQEVNTLSYKQAEKQRESVREKGKHNSTAK